MKLTHFQCDSSILTKSKKLSNSQAVDQANLEKNVNKLIKLANNKNEAQKNISEINNTILKIKNILERNKKDGNRKYKRSYSYWIKKQ